MELPIEMINNYIKRRAEDYNVLEKALEESDVGRFHKIGHQMKGNASSFGFDELTPLAIRMQQVTSSNIKSEGISILEDFKNWLLSKSTP